MRDLYLQESDFNGFVENLMNAGPVIGPIAKKNKFVFGELKSVGELRLDYDVSILPPKKVIFPPKQKLLDFGPEGAKSAIHPKKQVLLGAHFYDVKAIDMLDLLFQERFADQNYLANRNAITIVASNIQKISDRSFFGSVGPEVQARGHDVMLTKIAGGYLFEVRTPKGEELAKHGKFSAATKSQAEEALQVNQEVLSRCSEKLKYTTQEIADKVRASFRKKELWEGLAEKCFSCGTCNIVCPTCYCFDVQDSWNIDQKSGFRCRTWDGCLMEEFAKVSLGAGGSENFREEKGSRFRHRIMRKATYLNEKLGGPACVGCGRCSSGCVPDIADPVKIIHRVMED